MKPYAVPILLLAAAACAASKPDAPLAISIPAGPLDTATSGTASGAGERPRTEPAPTALTSKESKAFAHTLERMSGIRGLRATRPVPGVKLERDALVARVKDKALREFPPDVIRREGELLQLLGYAPPALDYLSETLRLLEAQLEGFYEPNDGTMYLAADLGGMEAEATLAHELVHALQDQAWDLKKRSIYQPGKGDETVALGCLAEGDATSAMMDFMLGSKGQSALSLPQEAVRELMANGMNGPTIQSVPHILRTTLVAPYIEGLAFVHALRRKGGWPMVDRAWAQPPVTTEQVLHVDKWELHEPPIVLQPPTATSLGSSFRLVDVDTFGELGFALAYEEWLDRGDARLAAAGWGGDRSAVYTKGDEIAFSVRVRYDDATSARPAALRPDGFATRAIGKLRAGMKKRLGAPTVDAGDVLCFDRADLGPLVVARRDRDLVLTAGPARVGKTSWTATSTCTQASTWAGEVLSMH